MSPTSETVIANALIDAGINEKISVQEAEAFLALLAGEPVAWRAKLSYGWALTSAESQAGEWGKTGGHVAPAPLSVAVKIKPLEWKNRTAKTDAGVMYVISGHRKLGERGFILRIISGLGTENHNIDDFDEAKAAAQADYESRIRSALTSPVGGAENITAEALRRISELTPARANARTANDLHLTVKAIADIALAGDVPTPASDITALREENERLLDELKKARRETNDNVYMAHAYRVMLGPIASELAKKWEDYGVVRQHTSWGPDAHKLTGEERAKVLLDAFVPPPSAPSQQEEG